MNAWGCPWSARVARRPVVRWSDHDSGPLSAFRGATFRFSADMLLVEAGVRAVAIFIGDPEFQLSGMIGLGRF